MVHGSYGGSRGAYSGGSRGGYSSGYSGGSRAGYSGRSRGRSRGKYSGGGYSGGGCSGANMDGTSHLRTSREWQEAVEDGEIEKVRQLVSTYGLSHASARPKGYHFLCSALEIGNVEIARYLLKSGSAVNIGNQSETTIRQNTPLHSAVSLGCLDVVKKLLNKYANVNAQNLSGQTPLHLAVATEFPKGGKNDVIQCLLDQGASVNALNSQGKTPLHLACLQKSLAVVTRLVARGASIHSEVSPAMSTFPLFTPLHFAISSGCVDIARFLIQKGAHVKIENKESPLFLAVKRADLPMIQLLFGAKLENVPLLLILSLLRGNRDIVEYLLENGADVNPTKSLHPLHFAAATGNVDLCKFLLEKGADVEAKQTLSNNQVQEFQSHLYTAGMDGRELLLSGCGKTALHFAAENHCPEVVEMLLQFGADVDPRDENGQTPLFAACSGKKNRVSSMPMMNAIRILIDWGTDMNIVDIGDQTIFDALVLSHGIGFLGTSCFRSLQRVLSLHLVKLSLAGFRIEKKLQAHVPGPSELIAFGMCGKDVAKLRSEEIVDNSGIFFYKIFTTTLNEMAVLTKKDGVAQVLKSKDLRRRFPFYAAMLKAKFLKGENRAKLLYSVPITFYENQVLCLPYICVRKIFDYLRDRDLKNLNNACKPLFK